MEPHLHRSVYDQDPHGVGLHSAVEDEGEHHPHEKKSVLKKVKDKAKKIKNKLTHHDGHEHERDHADDDYEEDDEDEETVDDPEVHGAPMYESAAIRSSIPAQTHGVPGGLQEDRFDNRMAEGGRNVGHGREIPKIGVPGALQEDRFGKVLEGGRNVGHGGGIPEIGVPGGFQEDRFDKIEEGGRNVAHGGLEIPIVGVPGGLQEDRFDRMAEGRRNAGHSGEMPKIGVPGGLQEDPHTPKSGPGKIPPPNYETKVPDPSGEGGKEADLSPLIRSLDKMAVSGGNPGTGREQRAYTGSNDQFAPESTPTACEFVPKTSDSMTGKSPDESGYVEKISVATSLIADKAISAKNAVASKLGYGETGESKNVAGTGASATPPRSPGEYVHKVAASVTGALVPVYEKVAGAGSTAVSKVTGSSATGQERAAATTQEATVGGGGVAPDKGVSVTEYLVEKLRPGEEDKALSEVISDSLNMRKENLVKSKQTTIEETPVGKVSESEEVRRELGSGMENKREGEDAIAAGKESRGSGSGVVDRIYGAVNSWINKGSEGNQEYHKGSGSSSTPDSAYVNNRVEDRTNIGG